MKQYLLLLILAATLFSSTEFEDAYKLYKEKKFEQAFVLFSNLAEEGDNDAAYILGNMYEHGEGCEANPEISDIWYKISSTGYYHDTKYNTSRHLDKQQKKLYETISKSENTQTQDTIRQITQSLYSLKAYKANYFLPVSYRFNGPDTTTGEHENQKMETEFQVSIKFDFEANLFDLNEIYSVAYTQKSFWQVYADSAYFRETNYNPEFSVTIPTAELSDAKFIKSVKLSLEHESNGRGGVEERSWNSLNSTFQVQYKAIFAELKLWYRLPDNFDYNPDLIDYMGYGHLQLMLPYEKHLFKLLFRHNFVDAGAIEANYSYPMFGRKDLFLYVKAFSGYGESLIDYDTYVNKAGIGFSLSR
ncbi:phospholipase A [Sulfurimonas sp.]|uniref:phospholipase A n=1 Tax=Sulfurimonas sp. TaxID=2022749 RepID=UPI0025D5D46B|nr:phospholipase A [Sulfurimonas sp.]